MPHTTHNSTLEWPSPGGLQATTEQDLQAALSTVIEAQDILMSNVRGVQTASRERQGSFFPTNNLPAEIFIQIFNIASTANTKKPTEYLCKLSLVCPNWKAIIYDTPILWTKIVCGDQVQRALKNSGEMPITAHMPIGEVKSRVAFRKFLRALEPHGPRLRSFSAADFGYHNENDPIYPPLEAVHTLHIASGIHRLVCRLNLTRPQVPNLRHLSLSRFVVPWESDLLSGLESLILLHLSVGYEPSLKAFGAVLDRCPTLKVLRILSNDKSGYGTESLDRPKIQLPLLEELAVKHTHSLASLPSIIEAPRLLELNTTALVNPRNAMTSMRAVEELLFPSNGTSVILSALRNSGNHRVSLWWESCALGNRCVWVGNYCPRNDLRPGRLLHPITFGFAIYLSLLEDALSLAAQILAASGHFIAVHVIQGRNLTARMLDALNHPAIDTLFFHNEDCLSTALPILTLLEAGSTPAYIPNLTSLVAHYRLHTIRELTRRAHLSGLVAVYQARMRDVGGSHPQHEVVGFPF